MILGTSYFSSSWAQPTSVSPSYQIPLTPTRTMTVSWPRNEEAPVTSADKPVSTQDEEFIRKIMALFQDAIINKLSTQVSLQSVTVSKGRVRLSGVLLRNAEIGLRLKNEGARKLADALMDRYGNKPNSPSWTRVLPLAKAGIMNDVEIGLKLDELSVGELGIDAVALNVAGLALNADAGPGDGSLSAEKSQDVLKTILQVLQRASISRAEAHLKLHELSAEKLRLSLQDFSLKNLHVWVTLRRAEDARSPATTAS